MAQGFQIDQIGHRHHDDRGQRSRCDDIRLKYGVAKLDGLSAPHIKKDLAFFDGHAANNRLKVWRSLCAYWDQVGLIETNVARLVAPRKTPKTDGHMAWSRDDFAAYRTFWPVGTKQRLAFELLYPNNTEKEKHSKSVF
ncbi:hypothetical protein [Yoonia sp. SDW83-1]|uniref:hypothetical protein n=1 Tax=Yoonia sp. SDW83-1 TaxID=3366945 RepID=UPI00398C2FE0